LRAVSCPSSGLCVAVGDDGEVLTSTNPTGGTNAWTSAVADPPFGEHYGKTQPSLTAVSCPSANLCVAGDDAGNVLFSTEPSGGTSAWKRTTSNCQYLWIESRRPSMVRT
jgi:hypothetical protein